MVCEMVMDVHLGHATSRSLKISDSPDEYNERSVSLTVEDSKDEPGMIGSTDHGGRANLQFEDDNSCSSSVAALCDSQPSDVSAKDVYLHEPDTVVETPVRRNDVTKGTCSRCFRGNRFTEKEACIVCGAKYCRSRVLRAMGSMPDGRKCVTCVGLPIDESKRGYLGKSSKILKRLLTDWEIEEIMTLEVSREANRLQPELVCINDKPLSLQELVLLQTCSNPPKKLKTGRYWYDKASGLWGKVNVILTIMMNIIQKLVLSSDE